MTVPLLARAWGGKVWRSMLGSVAALLATACFGVLVDSGWTLAQAAVAALCSAALLLVGGILVQQRIQHPGDAP